MKQESRESFEKLIEGLEGLIRLYRSLLQVVRKERDILASAHLDDLNDNNKLKEELLLKIRTCESSRLKWTERLAQLEAMPSGTLRLEDFILHFSGEPSERLRSLQSVLKLHLARVKKLNVENEVLVKSALNNISGAMNAIKDSLVENKTYKKEGQSPDGNALSGQLVSRQV